MCVHVYKDFTDKMATFRRKLSIKRLLTLSMIQNNCLSILPLCSYPHYLHPELMTFNIHPVSGRRWTFERFSFHLPMLQYEFCYSKYIPAAGKGKIQKWITNLLHWPQNCQNYRVQSILCCFIDSSADRINRRKGSKKEKYSERDLCYFLGSWAPRFAGHWGFSGLFWGCFL